MTRRKKNQYQDECIYDYDCPAGFYCVTGRWECRRKEAKWGSCKHNKECATGLECKRDMCLEIGKNDCVRDSDCGSSLKYCSTVDQMCYYKGYEGASCRFFSECHNGFICKYGKCEPEESSSSSSSTSTTGRAESGSSVPFVIGIVLLILLAMLGIAFVVVKILKKKDVGTQNNVPQ